jgi:hypothetical protein
VTERERERERDLLVKVMNVVPVKQPSVRLELGALLHVSRHAPVCVFVRLLFLSPGLRDKKKSTLKKKHNTEKHGHIVREGVYDSPHPLPNLIGNLNTTRRQIILEKTSHHAKKEHPAALSIKAPKHVSMIHSHTSPNHSKKEFKIE